jgi:hypothetical protein
MEFLIYNKRQIIIILFICMIFGGLVGYQFGLQPGTINDVKYIESDIKSMSIPMIVFSLLLFMVYFFRGAYYFYETRRLLSDIEPRGILDIKCRTELVNKKGWFFFTRECLFGSITGFPTVVYIDTPIGRSMSTNIIVYVFINKLNSARPKKISFPVKGGALPPKIKEEIFDFVSKLKEKGYSAGDIKGADAANCVPG